MKISNTKSIKGKLVFYYHLAQPYGNPDVEGLVEVKFTNIEKLPRITRKEMAQAQEDSGQIFFNEVFIPETGLIFVLRFASTQKTISELEETFDGGPFILQK